VRITLDLFYPTSSGLFSAHFVCGVRSQCLRLIPSGSLCPAPRQRASAGSRAPRREGGLGARGYVGKRSSPSLPGKPWPFPASRNKTRQIPESFKIATAKPQSIAWERKSPFQINAGSFSPLIPRCFGLKIHFIFSFPRHKRKILTPPTPRVAQGVCQLCQLRKQDGDQPSLPRSRCTLRFLPSQGLLSALGCSAPSSHNPCFFCRAAARSLPSWRRARSPGPPQLMQYLPPLGAAENEPLCAGQLREGGGARGSPLRPPCSWRLGWNQSFPGRGGPQAWAGHGLSVGQGGRASIRVSKGTPRRARGRLGTRGQSSWPRGCPGPTATRTAGQILSFWKDGNKNLDFDLQEKGTAVHAWQRRGWRGGGAWAAWVNKCATSCVFIQRTKRTSQRQRAELCSPRSSWVHLFYRPILLRVYPRDRIRSSSSALHSSSTNDAVGPRSKSVAFASRTQLPPRLWAGQGAGLSSRENPGRRRRGALGKPGWDTRCSLQTRHGAPPKILAPGRIQGQPGRQFRNRKGRPSTVSRAGGVWGAGGRTPCSEMLMRARPSASLPRDGCAGRPSCPPRLTSCLGLVKPRWELQVGCTGSQAPVCSSRYPSAVSGYYFSYSSRPLCPQWEGSQAQAGYSFAKWLTTR